MSWLIGLGVFFVGYWFGFLSANLLHNIHER